MDKRLGPLFERAENAVEEAKKLSTKKRTSLPDSSFCGPSKSFPINDCAHYTAGLRLLNRSKFSDATKKRIRTCIMRKGKSMGCPGAKKEKADYATYLTKDMEDMLSLSEFQSTVLLVEESIKFPGMELDFTGFEEVCNCED